MSRFRQPLYAHADYRIKVDKKTIQQVCEEIIAKLLDEINALLILNAVPGVVHDHPETVGVLRRRPKVLSLTGRNGLAADQVVSAKLAAAIVQFPKAVSRQRLALIGTEYSVRVLTFNDEEYPASPARYCR